jgi:uncharacterized membrane protein
MPDRIRRAVDVTRERLWIVPAAAAVLAAVAADLLVRLDRSLNEDGGSPAWIFGGTADAARSVLSTIATATMTVLGVTLSITLAVYALTAQGYSPRALRRFVRDALTQAVVGGFVGAFVFALVALREVREDDVPGVTVNVAVLLTFAVLGLLIAFFHHMASEIRVERLVEAIWEETRVAAERLPAGDPTDRPPPELDAGANGGVVRASATGRIRWFDDEDLAAVAAATGGTALVLRAPGEMVHEGEPLVSLVGGRGPTDDEVARVRRAVTVGTQRTVAKDVAFGLRQLTDIALRALSPGVNDPSTAEEAILRSADLLRRLADRRLGAVVLDDDGRSLVVRERPTWDDMIGLAFDQCTAAAEAQADAATMRVLLDAIGRVFTAARAPDRLEVLRARARRVRDGARRALPDSAELARVEALAARLS